jgi:hypothetical protein
VSIADPFPTAASVPGPLSTTAWRRVRLALTTGVFVAATVAAVGVGLQGAAVSPVAPAAATAAAPAGAAGTETTPTPPADDHGPDTGHRGHR